MTVKQWFRTVKLDGKVDVVLTDSPFILGLAYAGKGWDELIEAWIIRQFRQRDNLTIFLERNPDPSFYNPNGRNQSYVEAKRADEMLLDMLMLYEIPYVKIPMRGRPTVQAVYRVVQEALNDRRAHSPLGDGD